MENTLVVDWTEENVASVYTTKDRKFIQIKGKFVVSSPEEGIFVRFKNDIRRNEERYLEKIPPLEIAADNFFVKKGFESRVLRQICIQVFKGSYFITTDVLNDDTPSQWEWKVNNFDDYKEICIADEYQLKPST